MHIEPDPGDLSLHLVPGLYRAFTELHLEITLSMAVGAARQQAEAEVAAIGVELTHRRGEVMQVGFHGIEHRVAALAVAASALLPALALLTEQ